MFSNRTVKLIEEIERIMRISCEIDQLPCYKGLYKCQKEALMEILEKYFINGSVSGIVQMPTGTGKTVLAAALMLSMWKYYLTEGKNSFLAFFLAPRTVIRRQAKEKFWELLELISRKIYSKNAIKVMEASEEESGSNIAIRVCKTLRNVQYFKNHARYVRLADSLNLVIVATPQLIFHYLPSECLDLIKKNTDVFVMDEIHTYYIGEKTIEKIKRLLDSNIPVIIGLTATPVQEAVKLLRDGIIYSYNSYKAMSEGILVKDLKLIQYVTNLYNLHVYGVQSYKGIDEWRIAIKSRAKKYAEIIKEVIETIRKEANVKRVPKTLVVSPNVTEANYLYDELRKYFEPVYMAHYMVKEEPHKIIEEFKRSYEGILITVNMADIGFDDPHLELLIIARPVTNPIAYVQLRGRILRKPVLDMRKNINDNIKKVLNHAIIVDLIGKKDIIELEASVPDVESGKYHAKDLEGAVIQLKGYSVKTLEAEAKIDIKYRKEILLSEILTWRKLQGIHIISRTINTTIASYKFRITSMSKSELVLRIYSIIEPSFTITVKVPRIVHNYCETIEQITQQLVSNEKFRKNIKNRLIQTYYSLVSKDINSYIDFKIKRYKKTSKMLKGIFWKIINLYDIRPNRFIEFVIEEFVSKRIFPNIKRKIETSI